MKLVLHHIYGLLVAYGPLGVFVLSIVDSMGVPLPAAMDALVLGVAVGSVGNPMHAYATAVLAVLGSTGGNVFLFHAAQQGGKLFRREGSPKRRQRFQEWFHRDGLLTVFVPAVTPIVPLPLKVFVISAGALRIRFTRFLAVIVAARSIRYFGLTYLGLQFGAGAETVLRRHGYALAGALGVILGAFYLSIRYYRNRREVKGQTATMN
jgi:membrane protein DedA with SNARE-associated domain